MTDIMAMTEVQLRNMVRILRAKIDEAKARSRDCERDEDYAAMERWEGRKDGLQWVLAEMLGEEI